MDRFSAAEIDEPAVADLAFDDPEPLPHPAWTRLVSTAVVEAEHRSDVDVLVPGPGESDAPIDTGAPAEAGAVVDPLGGSTGVVFDGQDDHVLDQDIGAGHEAGDRWTDDLPPEG